MADHIEGTNALSGTFGAANATVSMVGYGVPATITVIPGSGCTVKAQTSTSSSAAVTAGTATWVDWDTGAVTANTSAALVSPVTALKFLRTVGAAESTYEIRV
jgi:hypothetical protein